MYYFGYCTWLDEPELHKYFPEATYVGRAVAMNHRVEFRAAGQRQDRGWCHLANGPGAHGTDTIGLVYEVADAHLKDEFDDFDIVHLTVRDGDTVYDCFTYVLSQPGTPMRPPDYYWKHIPIGLHAWNFPAGYISAVEDTYGQAAPCPDSGRPVPAAKPGRDASTR
jgi:hypothetical protein